MTARQLAAAAFAVLGVWYLGGSIAGFAAALAAGDAGGLGALVTGYVPAVALGCAFLALRGWLARVVADPEAAAAGAATAAPELQLVGITLVGVYLAASGVESFVDGTLQTILASEHDEYFQKTTYLRRNAGAIATTFVGFVVLTTSRQLHGWVGRAAKRGEPRSR
jgi:hypothetical protein